MSRHTRMRRARVLAWWMFAAAVIAALLAIWQWDDQWIATAGVLLFAAAVVGFTAIP